MTATDKLQEDVSKTTNDAISEGKKNVDRVKAVVAEVSRIFISSNCKARWEPLDLYINSFLLTDDGQLGQGIYRRANDSYR
jgi:hypothetical protein